MGCLRRGGALEHSVGSQRSSSSAPMPAVHSVILVFLETDALIKIVSAFSYSTGFLKESIKIINPLKTTVKYYTCIVTPLGMHRTASNRISD